MINAAAQQASKINRDGGVIYLRDLLLTDTLFAVVDFLISTLAGAENEVLQCAILDLLFNLFGTELEDAISFFSDALVQALRSSSMTLDIDLMEYLRVIVFDASELPRQRWNFEEKNVVDADTLKQMCQPVLQQVSPSASWRTDYDVIEIAARYVKST